jgi:hypothetical protein
MSQREENAMHCTACARDEGRAVSDDQAEVINGCNPAVFGINPLFSQQSIVHEQSVEKDVYSSGFVIYHCNYHRRNLSARDS